MFGCLGRGLGLEASCGFLQNQGILRVKVLQLKTASLGSWEGLVLRLFCWEKPEAGFSVRPSEAIRQLPRDQRPWFGVSDHGETNLRIFRWVRPLLWWPRGIFSEAFLNR